MCTKESHWSRLASRKGKAARRMHALSARRRRQQANLEQNVDLGGGFLRCEGGPASSKLMVMIGAEGVGEEVMFSA